MIALHKNELDAARTKKYGFADHCNVLKHWEERIFLVVSVKMSYFAPSGRARMKPIYTYTVWEGERRAETFTSKQKALKGFNALKRQWKERQNETT
jgi:hypothetical protein